MVRVQLSSVALLLSLSLISTTATLRNVATEEQQYLSPEKQNGCVSKCDSFHAGATKQSTLVCMFQASGVGTIEQNIERGNACFPAYNCREDWNVCINWNENDETTTTNNNNRDSKNVVIPVTNPLANVSDLVKIRTSCEEITSLVAGGNSGATPPSGGWKPTSLGWHKGAGNIGCGWGSTFSNVAPNTDLTLSDFGRVELDPNQRQDITSEVDCCVEAMKYEGVGIARGGAAIRFDYYNGRCRIDRELMMRGNLDTSGGRPLNKLHHCGEDGVDFFYWRNSAGAADAANLRSAGRCALTHNFTRIEPLTATIPLGRIPDGSEIPNRLSECQGSQPEMCMETLRYNAINTAEGCCEACASLKYLPGTANPDDNTPCVAFQIVDGKCRIIREKFIKDRWGVPNHGTSVNGNKPMSVTDVMEACVGFQNHDTCARNDNSHGTYLFAILIQHLQLSCSFLYYILSISI